MKVNGQWIPCVRNSSYSFILILLRCLDNTLKMCMWFGYNQIIFFDIFSQFSGILTMKVNGQWVSCVRNSSYSDILILLKLLRRLGEDVHVV